jgi:MFS family permease
MGTSTAREPGSLSRPVALLVAGATFLELLDGTALTTAAPRVAAALGSSAASVAIPISAYLMTVAALIPIGGWVVDRLGGRRTFTLAVAVFCGASAICVVAQSLAMLTAARILQGAGGALMVPVGRLVVLRGIRREEVIRAVAYFTWPALTAPLLGPVIGGLLATYASWRWIFLVNVPLGVVALCFTRVIPGDREPRRRLDVRGWCASAACLAFLTAAAEIFALPGARALPGVGCLLAAAVAAAAAVRRLRTADEPLVSLAAMRFRSFRLAQTGGSVFRVSVNAIAFLVPLLFVDGFGWSPAHAGEALVALFAGNLGIKPATTGLLRRFGFRSVLIASVAGCGVTAAMMALPGPHTPEAAILVLLVASGAFRSVGFTAYNTVTLAEVDAATLTDANTLSSVIQQAALGLGAATGALALRLAGLVDATGAYRAAFVITAVLFGYPLVQAALAPADIGSHLTARRA